MKNKILIPSVMMCVLAAGAANAQLAGGSTTSGTNSRNVTGAAPMAPGNPNTSTIVPDNSGIGANSNAATGTSSTGTMDTTTGTLNSVMPSSGSTTGNVTGNVNTNAMMGTSGNLFATAPTNMSLPQFTTYMRGQWGINGNNAITQTEWNNINPSFFDNNKPSFSSLDTNHNGVLDNRDLRTVYSGLYQQYKTQSGRTTVPAR